MNDAALVDALEAELEQARTALSALEEASAGERLNRVEAQLLAHPHLPQAAFLMGECLALQAQAARARAPALSRARELEARRLALEGPRATPFGGTTATLVPLPAPLQPGVTLEVDGLAPTDELELDGVKLSANPARVTLIPGLHHARVFRGGRLIFATFSEVSADQKAFSLSVPQRLPCSAEDLELVPRTFGSGPSAMPIPGGIRCEHWARVREIDLDGGIAVALCERSACGDFITWRRQQPAPFTPIAAPSQRFPTWAGFALAGAAALAASSLLVWQSGALERGRPSAGTWQYDGLNPQALRF